MSTAHWYRRHPWAARTLVLLSACFAALCVAEGIARRGGVEPGFVSVSSTGFQRVDELVLRRTFFTDEEGVFRAHPKLEQTAGVTLNSEGFRSGEFEPSDAGTPSILFLGDSFTWGSGARPLTRCFVDLVARDGYICFNTGIPGVDPGQYASLAEKYVPRLQPDAVAVMLCLANDICSELLPMRPHQHLHYVTNAGWLRGFDEERRFLPSAQDAYDHYVALANRVSADDRGPVLDTLRAALTTSALGTRFWVAVAEPERKRVEAESYRGSADGEATIRCLERIRTVSREHGARFLLFLIPVPSWIVRERSQLSTGLLLLAEFEPRAPELSDEHYRPRPNTHFNNVGHRRYADFILETLESPH